jgi:hypothetical protein
MGNTDILTVLVLTGVLSEFKHFSSAEIYVGERFCLYYAEAEGLFSAEKNDRLLCMGLVGLKLRICLWLQLPSHVFCIFLVLSADGQAAQNMFNKY